MSSKPLSCCGQLVGGSKGRQSSSTSVGSKTLEGHGRRLHCLSELLMYARQGWHSLPCFARRKHVPEGGT
eukprot:1159003-Pelagomonas_calceolata.AAC.4